MVDDALKSHNEMVKQEELLNQSYQGKTDSANYNTYLAKYNQYESKRQYYANVGKMYINAMDQMKKFMIIPLMIMILGACFVIGGAISLGNEYKAIGKQNEVNHIGAASCVQNANNQSSNYQANYQPSQQPVQQPVYQSVEVPPMQSLDNTAYNGGLKVSNNMQNANANYRSGYSRQSNNYIYSTDDAAENLRKLKRLYEEGLITQAEYSQKKSEIIEKLG